MYLLLSNVQRETHTSTRLTQWTRLSCRRPHLRSTTAFVMISEAVGPILEAVGIGRTDIVKTLLEEVKNNIDSSAKFKDQVEKSQRKREKSKKESLSIGDVSFTLQESPSRSTSTRTVMGRIRRPSFPWPSPTGRPTLPGHCCRWVRIRTGWEIWKRRV